MNWNKKKSPFAVLAIRYYNLVIGFLLQIDATTLNF